MIKFPVGGLTDTLKVGICQTAPVFQKYVLPIPGRLLVILFHKPSAASELLHRLVEIPDRLIRPSVAGSIFLLLCVAQQDNSRICHL